MSPTADIVEARSMRRHALTPSDGVAASLCAAPDAVAQADDARAFIRATYLANGVLWVMIGIVTGALANRWNRRRIVDDGRASEATHS